MRAAPAATGRCRNRRRRNRDRRRSTPACRSSAFRYDQPGKTLPIERGSGIGLASRCYVAVTDDVAKAIAAIERLQQTRQYAILDRRVWNRIGPLELDAEREIV